MLNRKTGLQHARRRAAFTLLEVLIVVAIIVMLAGAGTYYFLQRLESAKIDTAKAECKAIAAQCGIYYSTYGQFPPNLEALTQVQPDGRGAFFPPEKLLDPWKKPYMYDPAGPSNGGNEPDVYTTTPRGQRIGNFRSQ